jgi:hypothetical protein
MTGLLVLVTQAGIPHKRIAYRCYSGGYLVEPRARLIPGGTRGFRNASRSAHQKCRGSMPWRQGRLQIHRDEGLEMFSNAPAILDG